MAVPYSVPFHSTKYNLIYIELSNPSMYWQVSPTSNSQFFLGKSIMSKNWAKRKAYVGTLFADFCIFVTDKSERNISFPLSNFWGIFMGKPFF